MCTCFVKKIKSIKCLPFKVIRDRLMSLFRETSASFSLNINISLLYLHLRNIQNILCSTRCSIWFWKCSRHSLIAVIYTIKSYVFRFFLFNLSGMTERRRSYCTYNKTGEKNYGGQSVGWQRYGGAASWRWAGNHFHFLKAGLVWTALCVELKDVADLEVNRKPQIYQ